jgi:hypothetical protein
LAVRGCDYSGLALVLEPIALTIDVHDGGVMQDAIEYRQVEGASGRSFPERKKNAGKDLLSCQHIDFPDLSCKFPDPQK